LSRNTAAVESYLQGPTLKYSILCDINSLTSGNIRICTGGNFIYTGASTYSPIFGLGGMDPVTEGSDVFARAVRLKLAVNTASIVDLVAENLFNKPVALWRCMLDSDKATMIDTPQLLFRGRINTADLTIDDPQIGSYYEIEVESRLKQNPRAQYFDTQTLQTTMGQSGDTFFSLVTQIPNFVGKWGQFPTGYGARFPNGPGPGNPGGPGHPIP
jgi:hypothetical protein